MSINERSDIMSALYRARADLGVIFERCRDTRAVSVGVFVQAAQNSVNEALDELKPEPLELVPGKVEFPRAKF